MRDRFMPTAPAISCPFMSPLSSICMALLTCSGVCVGLRPPTRSPRRRLAFNADFVRSAMRSRSIWATPAMMVKISSPAGVKVSIPRFRIRNPISRYFTSRRRPVNWVVERPSRDSSTNVSRSPVRSCPFSLSMSSFHLGRFASCLTEAFSSTMRSQPAAVPQAGAHRL